MAAVEAFGVPRVFLKNSNKVMEKLYSCKVEQIPRRFQLFFLSPIRYEKCHIFKVYFFLHLSLVRPASICRLNAEMRQFSLSAVFSELPDRATADINT